MVMRFLRIALIAGILNAAAGFDRRISDTADDLKAITFMNLRESAASSHKTLHGSEAEFLDLWELINARERHAVRDVRLFEALETNLKELHAHGRTPNLIVQTGDEDKLFHWREDLRRATRELPPREVCIALLPKIQEHELDGLQDEVEAAHYHRTAGQEDFSQPSGEESLALTSPGHEEGSQEKYALIRRLEPELWEKVLRLHALEMWALSEASPGLIRPSLHGQLRRRHAEHLREHEPENSGRQSPESRKRPGLNSQTLFPKNWRGPDDQHRRRRHK